MNVCEDNLPRPRVWSGMGICQRKTFRTEDHPLPVWCYWHQKDEDGHYQSVHLQMRTPPGWSQRTIRRRFRLDGYTSPEKAINAIAKDVVLWGRAMYGDSFSVRYQQAIERSELRTNTVQIDTQGMDGLELPDGVYCRMTSRRLANGYMRQRVRIMATWREGVIGKRRQREKGFDVTVKRSLEQAISEAIAYRQKMVEEHGVYRSKYDGR